MPPQVVAQIRLVAAVVGELHAKADRDAARRPSIGGVANDRLALRERGCAVRRRARFEIDVVGDGQLVDPAFERLFGVRVDPDIAVRRQVAMKVRVKR